MVGSRSQWKEWKTGPRSKQLPSKLLSNDSSGLGVG
jgi:hypothetical protein